MAKTEPSVPPVHQPYVSANEKTTEGTVRAVVLGIILSIVFTAANAYLGLYVGMTVSASIPAAVISMAILRKLMKTGSILENNLVQTIASAGVSLASGIIFTIPAFFIWNATRGDIAVPSIATISLISIMGGALGILMMIPLRRLLIRDEASHAAVPRRDGVRGGADRGRARRLDGPQGDRRSRRGRGLQDRHADRTLEREPDTGTACALEGIPGDGRDTGAAGRGLHSGAADFGGDAGGRRAGHAGAGADDRVLRFGQSESDLSLAGHGGRGNERRGDSLNLCALHRRGRGDDGRNIEPAEGDAVAGALDGLGGVAAAAVFQGRAGAHRS